MVNEQLILKEGECHSLLCKVDQVEKENNKLLRTVEQLKREVEYGKESENIFKNNLG